MHLPELVWILQENVSIAAKISNFVKIISINHWKFRKLSFLNLYHYILVLGAYRPGVETATVGSSHELTCPAVDLSKNYQYKFYTVKLSGLHVVIPNANTKQFGHVW